MVCGPGWHTDCRWRFNGLTGQCTMLYSNIPSLPPSKSYIPICYIPIFICYSCMQNLYAIFICNIYMQYLYAIFICYIYMQYLYAIFICYIYSNIPSLPPSKSYIPICYIPIFLQVHYKSPNCCPISWARKIRRICSPNCQHTHRPVNTKWELALTNWNHFLFNLILVFVFVFVSPDRLEPLDHIALGFVSEALQVYLDQVGTVIAHFLCPPLPTSQSFKKATQILNLKWLYYRLNLEHQIYFCESS